MTQDPEKTTHISYDSPRELTLKRLKDKGVEESDFVRVDLTGFGYPHQIYIAKLTAVDFGGNCHIAITKDPLGNPFEITISVTPDKILNKVPVGKPITSDEIESRR